MPRSPRRFAALLLFSSVVFALPLGAETQQPARGDTVLYRFQGARDGANPSALSGDSSGALYGTTFGGGTFNKGTVFKLTPAGQGYTESILHRFPGGNDGAYPSAAPFVDKDGALFGVTQQGGGVPGYGMVFKLTPTGRRYAESIVYRFQGGSDGASPNAALISDNSGAFYGTTNQGGGPGCSSGCGTVFKLTPSSSGYVERVLYAFTVKSDGTRPNGALVVDRSGALYGTTSFGGSSACQDGCGIVFKLTPAGSGYTESAIYRFQGAKDGAYPFGALIVDNAGTLYGTTYGGGYGDGTVFSLTPSGSAYTKVVLHDFKGGPDGIGPFAGVLAVGSALYGTTTGGGDFGWGTVFKVIGKANEVVRYAFRGYDDGASPNTGLIVGIDGALYGTTGQGGGGCDCGTVFRLAP